MSDLVDFLRAQLDEDEQAARDAAAANPGSAATHWSAEQVDYISSTGLRGKAWAVVPERVKGATIAISPTEVRPRFVTHIARHDPARVLAEVEAKRRMVDECAVTISQGLSVGLAETMLAMLALPYADRPGYKDEWRL